MAPDAFLSGASRMHVFYSDVDSKTPVGANEAMNQESSITIEMNKWMNRIGKIIADSVSEFQRRDEKIVALERTIVDVTRDEPWNARSKRAVLDMVRELRADKHQQDWLRIDILEMEQAVGGHVFTLPLAKKRGA